MVTMSNVWDRTVDVLRGRAGVLAGIAVLTLYLPTLAQNGVALVAAAGSTAFVAAGALVAIVGALIGIWGQLALIAVATDPATTRADAFAQASARFPAALAVTIVAFLVLLALALPIGVAIGLSGIDMASLGQTGAMPDLGGGTVTFVILYLLALLLLAVFVGARLILANPVVLNERRGLGAFRRSFELTRGLTWRIVGVIVLYGVVIAVAASAAQFLIGAIVGLIVDNVAVIAFVAAAISGVVTTIFSVIAAVFIAQLYVSVTQRGVATVFE